MDFTNVQTADHSTIDAQQDCFSGKKTLSIQFECFQH
jgi:hypothetical protein